MARRGMHRRGVDRDAPGFGKRHLGDDGSVFEGECGIHRRNPVEGDECHRSTRVLHVDADHCQQAEHLESTVRARQQYGIQYTRCRISELKEDPETKNLVVRFVPDEITEFGENGKNLIPGSWKSTP